MSFLASGLRLGAGGRARTEPAQDKALILYEFENCPYCRIARESLSAAGVRVEVRPCPKGGTRFRPEVARLGGKSMFPYLIDPNTNTAMYESADIARHARNTYGSGRMPVVHRLGPLNIILSIAVFWARPLRGMFARTAEEPAQALEFNAAEHTPGARIIREFLSTREIRYVWSSMSDTGSPALYDPNTGEVRTGSLNILTYLDGTYPS